MQLRAVARAAPSTWRRRWTTTRRTTRLSVADVLVDAVLPRGLAHVGQDRRAVGDGLLVGPRTEPVAEREHVGVRPDAGVAEQVPGAADRRRAPRAARYDVPGSRSSRWQAAPIAGQPGADDQDVDVLTHASTLGRTPSPGRSSLSRSADRGRSSLSRSADLAADRACRDPCRGLDKLDHPGGSHLLRARSARGRGPRPSRRPARRARARTAPAPARTPPAQDPGRSTPRRPAPAGPRC